MKCWECKYSRIRDGLLVCEAIRCPYVKEYLERIKVK